MEANDSQKNVDVDIAKTESFFRAENWFAALKEHTFDTVFVTLTLEESKVLLRYREIARMLLYIKVEDQNGKYDKSAADTKEYESVDKDVESQLLEEEKTIFKKLVAKMDAAIQPFVAKSGGAFVKLSTRSPKDAAVTIEKIKTIIANELKDSKAAPKSIESQIENARAFCKGCCYALKVESGLEALQLLLRSERTYRDMLLMQLHQGESNFVMSIIVREWHNISPEWEFRAFVMKGKMTTCTQYYPYCFVPEMLPVKEKIQNLILSYWESMKHIIPVDSYTVDFVTSPDLSKIWIIEINHTPPRAGTALFTWDNPEDQKRINEGPFELRIHDKLPKDWMADIHPPLVRYMNSLRGISTDEEAETMSHKLLSCDGCRVSPITEAWYRCVECSNEKNSYDLCLDCYSERKKIHNTSHSFKRLGKKQNCLLM